MTLLLVSMIVTGFIGAGLFATGIVLSITPLTATGIGLLIVMIAGLIVDYCFFKKETVSRPHNPVTYSTNNMNTMERNPTPSAFSTKRNKSDTDLELMSRQSEEAIV